MKANEAIERVDVLRPNPFSEEEKLRWLSELDGKISKEVLKLGKVFDYTGVEPSETELLVRLPYTDVYLFYLCAMIDFFSRDYEEYNNSMLMVNTILNSLAKAVIRGDEVYKDEYSDSESGGAGDETGENTENGDGGNYTEGADKGKVEYFGKYYINIF